MKISQKELSVIVILLFVLNVLMAGFLYFIEERIVVLEDELIYGKVVPDLVEKTGQVIAILDHSSFVSKIKKKSAIRSKALITDYLNYLGVSEKGIDDPEKVFVLTQPLLLESEGDNSIDATQSLVHLNYQFCRDLSIVNILIKDDEYLDITVIREKLEQAEKTLEAIKGIQGNK